MLESGKVERLWLPALLALDQRLTDALDLQAPFLLAPDEVTDRLAVIGVAAGVDLGGDPRILLFGQGNGLANGRHIGLHVMLLVLFSTAIDSAVFVHRPIP
ncbi:hypothetical protein ACVWYO_005092 [Sphingomonas sp. UYP23]